MMDLNPFSLPMSLKNFRNLLMGPGPSTPCFVLSTLTNYGNPLNRIKDAI